jgi:hypothetical protein
MTMHTAWTKTLAFAVASYVAATAQENAAHADCTTDMECKGTRVCNAGTCVEGAATQTAASSSEQPPVRKEMHLTDSQLADLKAAGARLDAKDLEMAERLEKRGIGANDFVAAYREYGVMKSEYPEVAQWGSTVVETLAVANKMGLDGDEKSWFLWTRHQRDRNLTETPAPPSGPTLVSYGMLASAAGTAVFVAGLVLSRDKTYDQDSYEDVPSKWGYTGMAMALTGGVAIAGGLSAAIIGIYRWTTPAGAGTADSTGNRSARPSASARQPSSTRWALLPSFGPHEAGLGVTTAF